MSAKSEYLYTQSEPKTRAWEADRAIGLIVGLLVGMILYVALFFGTSIPLKAFLETELIVVPLVIAISRLITHIPSSEEQSEMKNRYENG